MGKTPKSAEIARDFFPQKETEFSKKYQQGNLGKFCGDFPTEKFSTFHSNWGKNNGQKKEAIACYRQELTVAIRSLMMFCMGLLSFFSSFSILVMEDKMVVWSLPPNSLPISGEDRLVRVRTR